ncbi:bifunctional adenosylcobinamide kinase/adenosylcobinamide-phosphate guanylyltransferase [Lederbergia citrea]|uniref:bifunctional adenosylcobinamide kinase/adenosylcobinamide-phosphate guanylyltransferase n=1 Tax=Lederbergia citrea TaxID=2833581 RepID=UPI001BC8F3EF|nr:bifunctional adenosylcobinamide kinase/adenosylcobinamide-phosphate guanylyltransferase [Lederbergia citrea]MBS4178022.1 bifunctional adenosylcobinamide kinase/adenosylcobinamide-phosphate guanylyltransferase [Lederbergia citrea]
MHFITGGAFNGKAKWVRKFYSLDDHDSFLWLSAYQSDIDENFLFISQQHLLVVEGVEQWIKSIAREESDSDAIRTRWRHTISRFREWEASKSGRTVILIGTDITKGIVPMDPFDRLWRDVTGWAYQDTVVVSDRVDLIFYGLANRLK